MVWWTNRKCQSIDAKKRARWVRLGPSRHGREKRDESSESIEKKPKRERERDDVVEAVRQVDAYAAGEAYSGLRVLTSIARRI